MKLGQWSMPAAVLLLAGCGSGGHRPTTVTGIPYGTITVANENAGSVFECKNGLGMRILPHGSASFGTNGHGIRVWSRRGHYLVSCTRH